MLARLSSQDLATRIGAIDVLVQKHLSGYSPPSEIVEDAVIHLLTDDPDPRVREELLSQIAERFVYWVDSPVGEIRLGLMKRILDAVPAALALATPDDRACYAAGRFVGQNGDVDRLRAIPSSHATSFAFRQGLLDGVTTRESEPASEALLRHLLMDPDPSLRAGAAELLEP